MKNSSKLDSSFRDPSGFLFKHNGELYRQVNQSYQDDYQKLMDSGLYAALTKAKLLIPHTEVDLPPAQPELAYRVIQPEIVRYISYPYEWSFSQLQDAALLTLKIQKLALSKGMSLKDSSAYNIQFHHQTGKPILIDSLSFETYEEGKPWTAYRQLCQHFLAPLALMAYTDVRFSQLLRVYIDGVPLDLASELLPGKTKFNFGLLSHIHLHANAQKRYAEADAGIQSTQATMSQTALLGLIDNLQRTTEKLSWQAGGTEWGGYYADTNYSDPAMAHKHSLVADYIAKTQPSMVWDLGANTGDFSRIASQQDIFTIAFDIDPTAVELNYRQIKANKETYLLPLVLDLTNPSPALGWNNAERDAILERGHPDTVLALALIHHLAISNNLPLPMLAEYFAQFAPNLIIEFVPKSDSQVKRLLATRKDIFPTYNVEGFEAAFEERYTIAEKQAVQDSDRTLYLLTRK